ncbi:MAG: InlB B-repeat-containing protein [Oscillospiraceae bacterium]|jgi:pilin isopeptide linkage protein/uncharacterized repeat protein (TIGR02543 family)|nr:InlB B-repeat-containing protein [Oscillospiraceae bacterium]
MASYNVGSQADLTAALASSDSNINITVTGSFEVTERNTILAGQVVTITDGGGGSVLTVAADQSFFYVSEDSTLLISGLTFDGSGSTLGSMIETAGTLSLSGVTLQNHSTDTSEGAAIEGDSGSVISMTDCTITNCHVTGFNGGGAIVSSGSLNMSHCTLTGNSSANRGGAIYVRGNYSNISNCTLSNNTCSGGDGGALYLANGFNYVQNCTISNNTASGNGGGIYINGEGHYSINANTNIENNTAGQNGGGIGIPYDKLSTMTVDDPVTFSGNAAQFRTNLLDSDYDLYNDHVWNETFTDSMPYGYNNYDIEYPLTHYVIPTGTKAATGKALAGNDFTFGIYSGGSLVATATNDAAGNIVLPEIKYTATGTNAYTIEEVTPSGNGWTTDSTTYPLNVTVDLDGDSYLTATPDTTTPPDFANSYGDAPVSASLLATKTANGQALVGGDFTFGVYEGDTLVATAANAVDGSVVFPAITYSATGTHNYTIREMTPSTRGWTTDSTEYPATVVVSDDGKGSLLAGIAYPNGVPSFTNTYAPPIGYMSLEARKNAVGKDLAEGQFTFGVFDGDTLLVSATNDSGGWVEFPEQSFTTTGTFLYTIKEISQSGNGWTTDPKEYTATIVVTDGDADYLNIDVTYSDGDRTPEFTNTYTQPTASVTLSGTKTANGQALVGGDFAFAIYEGATLIATAVNAADGSISFPAISYTAIGTHNYTIYETSQSGDGWTTDSTQYPATVIISDDGQGQLLAGVAYPDGVPSFVNTYGDAPASISLAATKTASGKALVGGEFRFGVYEGTTLVTSATNAANGAVTFPPIAYEAAGTHQYTIREMTESGNGWTTDTAQYSATVTITDDGAGHLDVTVAYPDGAPSFANTYTAPSTSAALFATKSAVGKALSGGDFTFGVYEGTALVATGTNAANGSITFPAIPYTQAGTHTYTVREISQSGDGWTTDAAQYPATVIITADGQGNLSAGIAYPNGTPNFTNTYVAPGASAILLATKAAVGKPLTGGDFQFGVYENDALVTSATNAADDTVVFPAISYIAAGMHDYTVREITQSGNGWTADATEYPATVTITADGTGNLTADVAYPNGLPGFINNYTATPASVNLSATKLAFGKALTDEAFTFGVFDSTGNLKSSATNAADGSISYPAISFDAPGTYYYYLQEITPSGNGWTTDTRKDPVIITVSDNGAGALVANVVYPFGAASFRNQYGASPAIVVPTATKTASGAALPARKFTFGLYNHQTGALVGTATNTGSGNITFSNLSFAEPGIYTYQVKESTPSTGGWTTDSTVYTAVITVTDDGSGQLTSAIDFSPTAPSFANTYDSADTSEDIYGYKVLENWRGEEVAFDFALTNPDGTVVATAQNSGGVIQFTTANLSSTGTYNYILKETSESGNGWTTDATEFPITVTVVDGGQGKLIATVDYPDGTPTFVNVYKTTPADLVLTGTKTTVGKALTGNDFIFGVYDQNGNIRASAYNDANGNITFPAIFFDKAGTMNYTVRELSTDHDGWITDKNAYPVTIEVVDNGDGTFSISAVRYTRGMPTFTNIYAHTPTAVNLYAAKYASGKTMAGNDFSFAVEAEDGTVMATAANDRHGSVSFPEISYDQPGVYHYTILETTPPGHGWNTDTMLIPVTITVTDNGQGKLNMAVSYPNGVPHFYNAYSENAVRFVANGGTPTPDQNVPYGDPAQQPADPTRGGYSFCGWFADAALTIPNDFSQPVTAPITLYACWTDARETYTVAFDAEGGSPVASQSIKEGDAAQKPADPTRPGYGFCGWFADAALAILYDFSQPVTGDMTLYACWSRGGHAVLTARKVLQGAPLAARQFAFRLSDESGLTMGTATNDAAGNIAFDSEAFALGKHVYTLQEVVQSTELYMLYDLRPRRITVTVSQSGDVTIASLPTFVNRYMGWHVNGGGNRLWTGGRCDRCEE